MEGTTAMILGLLSDTHLFAADGRLRALLAGSLGRAEVLVHAGDYAAEGVVDQLEFEDSRPFFGVAGNADPAPVARRLPQTRMFAVGGRRVGVVHGWGPREGLEDRVLGCFAEPPELVVYGHSHAPSHSRRGCTTLVNPGSAFDRRSAPRCTVALVTWAAAEPVVAFLEVGR